MKTFTKIAAAIALTLSAGTSFASTYVQGYTKSNGTYVQGHYRSSPNAVRYDNLNSQSNGGSQRDEYSNRGGATNKSNPSYNSYDNDGDGVSNAYDDAPEDSSEY